MPEIKRRPGKRKVMLVRSEVRYYILLSCHHEIEVLPSELGGIPSRIWCERCENA